MAFLLQCECGAQLSVGEGAAGTTVGCPCGRALAVPGLRELRLLPETTDNTATTPLRSFTPGRPRTTDADAESAGRQRLAPQQVAVLFSLVSWMRLVGVAMLLIGLLALMAGLATLDTRNWTNVIVGVSTLIFGALTLRVAAAFGEVPYGRGEDIERLVGSLRVLRGFYQAQAALLAIHLAVLVLILIALLLLRRLTDT